MFEEMSNTAKPFCLALRVAEQNNYLTRLRLRIDRSAAAARFTSSIVKTNCSLELVPKSLIMSPIKDEAIEELLGVLTTKRVVGFPIASFSVTYCFYGMYMVLVILCVSLLRHDQFDNRRFYLISTLLLYAICTIMVVNVTIFRARETALEFQLATTKNPEPFLQYAIYDEAKSAYYTLYYVVPPLANTVAGVMLIHRCYLVWGRKKRIAIALAILSSISGLLCLTAGILTAIGLEDLRKSVTSSHLILSADTYNFVGTVVSTVVNVAVTLLTAGRIWRINRQSQAHLGIEKDTKRISTAIRIILESGIIYPTVMIVHLIVIKGSTTSKELPSVDLYPVVVLSAGIAPTLAIVRAQIAKLTEKASSRFGFEGVSDIRFKNAHLGAAGLKSTALYSISMDVSASSDSDSEELRTPEPLVYPRQGVGLPSFFPQDSHERIDVEKGSI
ncbi:hypothetical protein PM082_013686 [Marasmius tenuissimus]|nr:hypothetical protein PM082_013686 [Marasmius tenuissimus]